MIQDVLASKDNWKDNRNTHLIMIAHLIVIALIVSHPVTYYPVNINSIPGYNISLVSFVDVPHIWWLAVAPTQICELIP